MRIEMEGSLSEEVRAAVKAGMRRHTESAVPWEDYTDLCFVARSDEDEVIGAAIGEAGRGWLHVSVVWVDEGSRLRGIGSGLLGAIEAEATRRGCWGAYLDTFSYQVRPFYEAHGYEVFGILEDYPRDHQRFYMRKRLQDVPPHRIQRPSD